MDVSTELREVIRKVLKQVTGDDLDDFILDYISGLAEEASVPMERALADVLVAYGLVPAGFSSARICERIDAEILKHPRLAPQFSGDSALVYRKDKTPISSSDWIPVQEDFRYLLQPGVEVLARFPGVPGGNSKTGLQHKTPDKNPKRQEFDFAILESVNHADMTYEVEFRDFRNKILELRMLDILIPASLYGKHRNLAASAPLTDASPAAAAAATGEEGGEQDEMAPGEGATGGGGGGGSLGFRPLEVPIRIADIREPVLLEPAQRRRMERKAQRERMLQLYREEAGGEDGDSDEDENFGFQEKRWADDPDPEVRAERERRIRERKQRARQRQRMEKRELEKQERMERLEKERLEMLAKQEEQNKIDAFQTYLRAILSGEERAKDVHVEGFSLSTPDGSQNLLTNADLKLSFGRRYGLIGRNGIGKSSLMRAAANYSLDGFPTTLRVIHVRQEVEASDLSVLDQVLKADLEREELLKEEAELRRRLGDVDGNEAEGEEGKNRRKKKKEKNDDDDDDDDGSEERDGQQNGEVEGERSDAERLNIVYQRMQEIDVWGAEGRAAGILKGLQFTEESMKKSVRELSGGWRMRVALAEALFIAPDVLLLDEPTNHLDFPAVIWLEDFLQNYPNTLVVVSHDRTFLNNVCTDIIHFHSHTLTYYRGNFDAFEKIKLTHIRAQAAIRESAEAKKQHMQKFIDKFRFNAKRAALVQSRIKALERVKAQEREELAKVNAVLPEDVQEEEFLMGTRIDFPEPDRLDGNVITLQNVEFGYFDGKTLLRDINCMVDMKSRIALIGANGIGKSTLLKVATGVLEPREGTVTINGNARIATFAQHHMDALRPSATPLQLLREAHPKEHPQVLRRHLGSLGLTGQLALRRCQTLSGGQRSRAAFAILTFKKPHFIVMDEPTNHLDLETVDALVAAVNNYGGGILTVSHDQHFLDKTCSEFWALSDGTLKQFHSLEEAKRFAFAEMKQRLNK